MKENISIGFMVAIVVLGAAIATGSIALVVEYTEADNAGPAAIEEAFRRGVREGYENPFIDSIKAVAYERGLALGKRYALMGTTIDTLGGSTWAPLLRDSVR